MLARCRWAGIALTVVAVTIACEEDDRSLGEGPVAGDDQGGDPGVSGAAGEFTMAGREQPTAGRGGSGTSGGGGSAGRSGSAGRGGGAGGTSGSGGNAGRGNAGGGVAGMAGGCSEVEPSVYEPECAEPTFTMGVSECGEALTRETLRCGQPGSQLDANCCYRPTCETDDECGLGGRCIPRLTQAPDAFLNSLFESCQLECGECLCGGTADLSWASHCIAPEENLDEFDCDVRDRSCEELDAWMTNMAFDDFQIGDVPELFLDRLQVCRTKVERERVERCEVPSCRCTGDDCSAQLGSFCPMEPSLGCPLLLGALQRPGDLCDADVDDATYSECSDGTLRFEWQEGGENDYTAVFSASGRLRSGSAEGYVGAICDRPGEYIRLATRDIEPVMPAPSCQSCTFCGGEGGAGSVDCVVDDQGRIALPE